MCSFGFNIPPLAASSHPGLADCVTINKLYIISSFSQYLANRHSESPIKLRTGPIQNPVVIINFFTGHRIKSHKRSNKNLFFFYSTETITFLLVCHSGLRAGIQFKVKWFFAHSIANSVGQARSDLYAII